MQSTESSISSIIAAFTSGLDVFTKLRTRRKKGSGGNKGSRGGNKSSTVANSSRQQGRVGEETRLTQSLRRGSSDVYHAYAQHARHDGARFATGDSAAHASLAHTLLKLNSGLVNIISAFLAHGRHDIPIDYANLTALSDTSRLEALDAMERLHSRLTGARVASQPRLKVEKQDKQGRKGKPSAKHTKEVKVAEKSPDLPPGIAKVSVNASQTQLAWARPVKKRKSSSAQSKSSSSTSLQSSTPTTPLPLYTPPPMAYPFPQPMQQSLAPQQSPPQRFVPQTQPLHVPGMQGQMPVQMTARRQDKVTPSFYSIATDSTKLGEIPMRKWATPFNQAEADRLNAIALASGWRPPPPPPTLEQQQKGRSRFMRLFGRRRNATAHPQAVR